MSGVVTFRTHILEDGTVGHLTVLSGPPELQQQAEKTVYRWRYTPWTANGQPIDIYTTIPIGFGLPKAHGSVGPTPKAQGLKISPTELQGSLVRSYDQRKRRERISPELCSSGSPLMKTGGSLIWVSFEVRKN
jgi:TonB family protein